MDTVNPEVHLKHTSSGKFRSGSDLTHARLKFAKLWFAKLDEATIYDADLGLLDTN